MLDLPKFPERIEALSKDSRGYPVPWFVQWIDGDPQFPIVDGRKFYLAINQQRCWICGERLGANLAFVVGPMCGINRTSAEPPSHLECAEFAVKACPFLKKPNMKRIDNEYTRQGENPGGVMILRNPGVTLIWVTTNFRVFLDEKRKPLLRFGNFKSISFWKEGRKASWEEAKESIEAGCPTVKAMAEAEGELDAFHEAKARFFSSVERVLKGESP